MDRDEMSVEEIVSFLTTLKRLRARGDEGRTAVVRAADLGAVIDGWLTALRERDEARAEAARLRARLHRCAQCGADDSAVAACEGDEYPLCGPCATHALREARAEAVAAREHTDREVTEICRTLPEALRLAAEDEREACAAMLDDEAVVREARAGQTDDAGEHHDLCERAKHLRGAAALVRARGGPAADPRQLSLLGGGA